MVRFAGGAGVFEFPTVFFADHRHGFVTERIIGIFANYEHSVGAGRYAISATVTRVGIDSDEEIARTVFVSIVRYHDPTLHSYFLRRLVSNTLANRAPPSAPAIWES